MSSQGFFESDEAYRDRISEEANENTIERLTGSAPSQGWLEDNDNYRERIEEEANEQRIEHSTGSAPSQGWLESHESYHDRVAREANESTVEDLTGSAPSQGWLESSEDYDTRVRREANEEIVGEGTGLQPKKGWLESDHDYRSRIAREANEIRASDREVEEGDTPYVSDAPNVPRKRGRKRGTGSDTTAGRRRVSRPAPWSEILEALSLAALAESHGGTYEFEDENGILHAVSANRTSSGLSLSVSKTTFKDQATYDLYKSVLEDLDDDDDE
jgi:hypothetical protein